MKAFKATLWLALVIAVTTAGSFAAIALADGDPASDVLLAQPVFYPYEPPVSGSLERALAAQVAASTKAGFKIRIALIDSAVDLGSVPQLFGQPQQYADFLDQEIAFVYRGPLLVVMPAGYGVQRVSAAVKAAVADLPKPAGHQSNDLARAALAAIPKLARAAGVRLPSSIGTTQSSGGGTSVLAAVLLVLAAILTALAVLAIRHRRAQLG